MNDERCWLCSFYQNGRCTHTFRLTIHFEPQPGAIGGQVDVQCTPGMVPQELIPTLNEYFSKFLQKALVAMSMAPVWDQIREYQIANPEAQLCPGRKLSDIKKSHLKIIKSDFSVC